MSQLTGSRSEYWHQDEKPLLTVEGLREWLMRCGLVAYGSRALQLGAPAPSLVEATLGKSLGGETEVAAQETARTLLARLITDGAAVPLNLLGATGGLGTDTPDFVVSAAVFSYIFTLRGSKAWKQAPATTGSVKVSPLALAAYEILAAKVSLSAAELATQLGKEVTESAVLRALTELWGQLRVLPILQADGSATLWELASSRFTKQIKSGANAGQPTALSALISLYLGQSLAASEDEIETFLSPLASRSRVRDVIHALLAARQLETFVIEGKTLLHLAGSLPVLAETPKVEVESTGGDAGSRITKFASKPGSKLGSGLRMAASGRASGFAKRPASGSRPRAGSRPDFGSRQDFGSRPAAGDRERRPFRRDAAVEGEKPRFDRPWKEDGKTPGFSKRERTERLSASGEGEPRAARGADGPRPYRPAGDQQKRRTFSKPGTFARKREGSGEQRDASTGDSRGPRRDFGANPGARGKGSFPPRPPFKREGGDLAQGTDAPRKTFRKFDAPRAGKPSFKPGPARKFAGRPADGAGGAKRDFRDGPQFSPGRSKFERSSPGRPAAKAGGHFNDSPAGKSGFSGKKPFAKSGSTFAKFADGKKPFRKPGPGKKSFGGKGGGTAGGFGPGGFKPVKRKRPEGNA